MNIPVSRFSVIVLSAGLILLSSGCITAHIDYSLSDVRPALGSRYAGKTLFIEKFQDNRYKDKKSVSSYVHKVGSYSVHSNNETHQSGIRPTPKMTDYRTVFKGVPYSEDNSYYSAPDRLYWVPNGPLTEMRGMLAKHIYATALFRDVKAGDDRNADYTLKLNVRRFLSLKERRPVVDVVDIFFTGFLFSSDEIISTDVEWTLVRNSDNAIVANGVADYGSVENHHSFAARKKPFKLNEKAAKKVAEQIIQGIKNGR